MATEFSRDDDRYLDWVEDNWTGFVLNVRAKNDPSYMVLHKASCWTIGAARYLPGGAVERSYRKVCSNDVEDLRRWVKRNGRPDGTFSAECRHCSPRASAVSADD